MKTFPTLYKKTSTGAIQEWTISVSIDLSYSTAHSIWTRYGQVDGKEQQTVDYITEGKNVGKKNETSIEEQAVSEAKSRWEKKKKSGYVESIQAAEKDETDDLIEGGVVPMLAQSFAKHGHKIEFPAYIQPKLDGIRCIAILKDRKCTLWSRSRKQIHSCPHIVAEIERIFISDIVLDGELYSHDFKKNFEHIVHLVRQDEPDEKCTDVEYHIYDTVNQDTFDKRNTHLSKCFTIGKFTRLEYLKLVETVLVNENEVGYWYDVFKKDGYEGAMLRNVNSLYVNKRSYDLQKMKEFQDEEFDIIGIEEGRGKLAGHVGAFVCRTKNGKTFLAKMSGDTEKLADYFKDHSLWIGKILTVQYQGLTGKEGVPRFPVGIRIRYE